MSLSLISPALAPLRSQALKEIIFYLRSKFFPLRLVPVLGFQASKQKVIISLFETSAVNNILIKELCMRVVLIKKTKL